MSTPHQIIVATDFSRASSAALAVARRLAPVFHAKVTLLHVFQYVPQHQYRVPVAWMVEIIRKDVQQQLEEDRALFLRSGIQAEVIALEDGPPAQQILAFLRTREAPLLIMGTHAFGGMERFLLGSTAEEVLRQAECPVITVGPHVLPEEASLRKILFATDFSRTSFAAIPLVLELQRLSEAHIRVLHVVTDPVLGEENKQFDPIKKALELAKVVDYVTLHGGNISQAVVNEAERYPSDLLVMGIRRAPEAAAHLAPKIAFQIIAAAPCAVLTISSRL